MAGVCAEVSFATVCCSVSGVACLVKVFRRKGQNIADARWARLRNSGPADCLSKKNSAHCQEADMHSFEEEFTAQTEIEEPAKKCGEDCRRQRDKKKVSDCPRPKARDAKAGHGHNAGGKKVALQRCAKFLR